MTRWIDMTDRQKAAVWLREARKTDWVAEMARIEAEAAAVKASDWRESRKERELAVLRIEYRRALDNSRFVKTGRYEVRQ